MVKNYMQINLKREFFILFSLLFFLLIEAVFLLSSMNGEFFLYKVLVNYLIVLSLVPFFIEKVKNGRVDPFSPLAIFSFFYMILFGIRAINIFVFESQLLREDEKYYILTMLYAIIGLHLFQIGYFSKLGSILVKNKKLQIYPWSLTKLRILLVIFSMLSITAFLLMVRSSGGFIAYFTNIQNAMVNIVTGSAFIFMTVIIIKIPLLIWFYVELKRKKYSFPFFLFFLLSLFLLFSLGERGHLVTLVLSLLVCYHYSKKYVNIYKIIAFGIILVFFLVSYDQYREYTALSPDKKEQQFNISLSINILYERLMNNFDQIIRVKEIVKRVPEELNYQYGSTFLNLAFKPIPSKIWAGKPQGAGNIVTKNLYPKHFAANASVAPSLLGELYVNFHIIGIALGMFLFGVLGKSLYKMLIINKNNKTFLVFYAFICPYVFSQLRGDFAVVSSFMIFNLIMFLIAINFITYREPSLESYNA